MPPICVIKMNKESDLPKEKKELLKELIKQLHEEEEPTPELRKKVKEILSSISAPQIARVEEELIKEGMSPHEIFRMCDIHLEVFKEALSENLDLAPPGHPVNILMGEHAKLVEFADELFQTVQELKKVKDFPFAANIIGKIQDILSHFKEAEKHYLREENVLFPYLQKKGITQPPKIMWMDHYQIRILKKRLFELIEGRGITSSYNEFVSELEKATIALAEYQSGHFKKENKMLFPTGLRVISDEEWKIIRAEFDEIGYCCFTPDRPEMAKKKEKAEKIEKTEQEGIITFETGKLAPEVLEAVLDTLPIDITFVDKDDKVAYFSNSKDRIFVRSKAIIGRSVQNCHPQRSIHIVNRIINEFREGKKDKAEFWIKLGDIYAYIRYFAVRDKEGNYLGTLEVSQDIAPIKAIEGEKRLLDWDQE